MDNVQKITRTLFAHSRTFQLRIHVKLINDKGEGRKENFHNLFKADDGKEYLNLDLQSFLTLEIKDGVWAPDKSILINQRNIYQIIRGFEKSIDAIYNGGIFAVKPNGEILAYKDKRQEHTLRLYNLGSNQRIVVEPSVIYDAQEDTTYEGVIMYLNKTENYVELPIDAYEALYHTLKETNLFVYSQMLVNYYMTSMKSGEGGASMDTTKAKTAPRKRKTHPLSSTTADEYAKSTLVNKPTSEAFFGFPKPDAEDKKPD